MFVVSSGESVPVLFPSFLNVELVSRHEFGLLLWSEALHKYETICLECLLNDILSNQIVKLRDLTPSVQIKLVRLFVDCLG